MIVVAGFGCVASCKTRTEWEKCVWLCGGDQKKISSAAALQRQQNVGTSQKVMSTITKRTD